MLVGAMQMHTKKLLPPPLGKVTFLPAPPGPRARPPVMALRYFTRALFLQPHKMNFLFTFARILCWRTPPPHSAWNAQNLGRGNHNRRSPLSFSPEWCAAGARIKHKSLDLRRGRPPSILYSHRHARAFLAHDAVYSFDW